MEAKKAMSKAVAQVDSVTSVEEVVSNMADLVVYFESENGIQALRVEWLRNHRDKFEIADYQRNGDKSWMQLKA